MNERDGALVPHRESFFHSFGPFISRRHRLLLSLAGECYQQTDEIDRPGYGEKQVPQRTSPAESSGEKCGCHAGANDECVGTFQIIQRWLTRA